jgi:hypothetical protein
MLRLPGEPSLERIELRITWTSGPQERTFTLDAHRNRAVQGGL